MKWFCFPAALSSPCRIFLFFESFIMPKCCCYSEIWLKKGRHEGVVPFLKKKKDFTSFC